MNKQLLYTVKILIIFITLLLQRSTIVYSAESLNQTYNVAHPDLAVKDLFVLAQNALDQNFKYLSSKEVLAYYFSSSAVFSAIYDGVKEASDQFALDTKGEKAARLTGQKISHSSLSQLKNDLLKAKEQIKQKYNISFGSEFQSVWSEKWDQIQSESKKSGVKIIKSLYKKIPRPIYKSNPSEKVSTELKDYFEKAVLSLFISECANNWRILFGLALSGIPEDLTLKEPEEKIKLPSD